MTALSSISTSTATRTRAARRKPTVAEYLTEQIRLSGKTQYEIAQEAGFNKPNIISMLKKGETKLPLSKIGPMAHALGVDPRHLFNLVMNEYEPQTWPVLESAIFGQPLLTQNEIDLIELIRTSKVSNPKISTVEDEQRVLSVIETLKSENA